jgi:hypothetical protein
MKDKLAKPAQGSADYHGQCASASLEVVDEAKKRLAGHEILARSLYELIARQASAREISVRKIVVLPAWSNEYEERTGIVIEAEIEGSTDQRFSLWDTVCEQIYKLQESLPEKESRFLSEDISFVVSRG